MERNRVCPFFGKGEGSCEVGTDYISPHDVATMVAYCSNRFRDCTKHQELAERQAQGRFTGSVRTDSRETSEVPAARGSRRGSVTEVAPFSVRWSLPNHIRYMSLYHHTKPILTREEETMEKVSNSRGWIVALAGTGINLALGILYTWSIFKGAIAESIQSGGAFRWDPASINDPYAVACLVFAAAMILAGKVQDRFGPRITCIVGGLLVGAGFFWISQSTSYWAWVVGFGVMAGMGIGFGYSAATPPALKWFPPAKTGLVAGIVVSGFGLASLYIAPLAKYMLGSYGLQQSMLFFGIAFAVVVGLLGLLVANPPEGYVPAGAEEGKKGAAPAASAPALELRPSELLKDAKFYTLWACFFIGAGAGLMVIGSAKGLAKASMGEMAFLVVAIMSIGNAAGRLIAGVVSDKIGRGATLSIMLVFQALLMFAAIPVLGDDGANPVMVVLLVSFMVFNYGTNLSLFPSFTKDLWGMKHFGMNYGLLFSAWGIGAFVLVRVAEMIKVKTGGFTANFAAAGVLLLVGAMLSLSLRAKRTAVEAEATAPVALDEEELELQQVTTK